MPRAISPRTWSAAGVAERCTIQVAYAIGVADPMSVLVDTHGTGKVDEREAREDSARAVPASRPTNIRRTLKLNRPIYKRTAAYGHFGRAPEKGRRLLRGEDRPRVRDPKRGEVDGRYIRSPVQQLRAESIAGLVHAPAIRLRSQHCHMNRITGIAGIDCIADAPRTSTRLLRPPQGPFAQAAPGGAIRYAAAAARARSQQTARRPISRALFATLPSTSCGSRSASAAPSI